MLVNKEGSIFSRTEAIAVALVYAAGAIVSKVWLGKMPETPGYSRLENEIVRLLMPLLWPVSVLPGVIGGFIKAAIRRR